MPSNVLNHGVSAAAIRSSFDPVHSADGDTLVLKADVDDAAVAQQAQGFNGMESAFALVPRYVAGETAWEKTPLIWQGALDGKRDTHMAWIDADDVDRQALADKGVAFGVDTNVGTLWLQRQGLNTEVERSWADIASGIEPAPVEEAYSYAYVRSDNQGVGSESGAVLAGKPLHLSYDRYQSDFGVSEELSDITMFMRVNGEVTSQTHVVDRPWPYGTRFEMDVPDDAKGDVEVWFQATGESGNKYWDSQSGDNWRFKVTPKPTATLRFDEQWNEAQDAPLKAGEAFQIAYDADRLHQFTGDGWYRMGPTFSAQALVSFNGRPPKSYTVARYTADYGPNGSPDGFELTAHKPTVAVPDDAESVKIWFRGYTVGRPQYDSNMGGNYSFDVQPKDD